MGMATKSNREYKPSTMLIERKIRVKLFFAWFDFWIGVYYDREFKVYIFVHFLAWYLNSIE